MTKTITVRYFWYQLGDNWRRVLAKHLTVAQINNHKRFDHGYYEDVKIQVESPPRKKRNQNNSPKRPILPRLAATTQSASKPQSAATTQTTSKPQSAATSRYTIPPPNVCHACGEPFPYIRGFESPTICGDCLRKK